MSANPHNARPELANPRLKGVQRIGNEPVGQPAGDSASPSAFPSISYAHGHEALQALLAFSSLHERIRERRARERLGMQNGTADAWELEQFVLDEVLHLVSERALTLTGADGVAIALVDGDAFVCRASAGSIAPEAGARLDPKSGFSGACLRTGGIVRCDDSEKDPRVDLQVCRRLGTRSIVAIPIASARGIIGLLEAFSAEAYGFNDSDVRSLNLLAELILSALKPEEENRMAEISQRLVAGDTSETAFSVLPDVEPDTTNGSIESDPSAVRELAGDESLLDELATESSTSTRPWQVKVEPGISPEAAPAIFQLGDEAHLSRPRLGLIIAFVLLALAAIAAGFWWNSHRQTSASQPAIAPASAAEQREQEAASPHPTGGVEPSSTPSAPPMLQQLVTGIWNVSSADSSTVVIDLQGEVQYEAHRLSDPERIYFDLHGTSLAHGLFGRTIEVGDPVLARVRIAQPRKGISRVVLETNGASDFSVSLQSNPYRLVVEIRKASIVKNGAISAVAGTDHPGTDARNTALQSTDLENNEPRRSDLNAAIASLPASLPATPGRVGSKSEALQAHVPKFRLVLDAGHGGWDLGTVGRKGLMEKDLVLDIVARSGKLVQSRLGAEVIFTRQDDTYLPLEKRTEIANLAQADMFVSVHANYSEDSSARGAETYYTNTYSSVRARTAGADTAIAENINWNNVDIREKVQQSRRFAVAVQQAMHRALAAQIPGMRNRGVKKASYVVLTGTSMPAILAEVSFVSSPADEDKLKSSSYRQNIAEALYKGIAQYAATNHHVNLASASSRPKGL
jgi:N-acetylmuramoyl-L-alanine amidase